GACISAATQVTINPAPTPPAAPTAAGATYCEGATAAPLTATGTNLLWYTTATGGTGSVTAPTPSTATPGTTSYWVSQTIGGCESPRTQVDVIVTAAHAAPTAAGATYCQGAVATQLTATGAGLLWYTTATGGIGSATAPTPSTAAPGTTSYWVSQTVGGCESPRTQVNVLVNATPAAQTANGISPTTCADPNGTITVLTPAPAAGISYSIDGNDYTNTTGVFTGVGAGTYSVTYNNGTCNSAATPVTINPAPTAPAAPTASATAQPTCSVATGTIT